ncbi:MAG: HAD hydrolase-like protein [Acutalibacteraceae bacterium]|nr:HAD hydrolase-like protein [Acutalibacteraceae bacterium]
MNKRYNILLFDLDDTLLDFTGDEKKAISTVLERHGLPCGEDVLEAYYNLDNWQTFMMGDISAKTVITNRFSVLLKILEAENIKELADEYYSLMLSSHKLIKGALKLLRRLKSEGYKLYITTNGYPEFQYKRIKDARIANFFDGIFSPRKLI